MSEASAAEQVTCRKCKRTFTPSFAFDFYPDGDDPKVGMCESCTMAAAFGAPSGDPSPLPDGHEEGVCKKGQGAETCSFLGFGRGGFKCLKGSSFESAIQERRREGSMAAKGDNCSGPPDFRPTGIV